MGVLERFRVDGRVAIVTGAGRGIGRGIAVALAEAGAHVVLCARTMPQLEETAAQAQAHGVEAVILRSDVRKPDEMEAVVASTMERFGRIDVLVNNAGGAPPTPALKLRDSAFEDAFSFNVTSALRRSRLVAPHMLEAADGGAIVNVSSALSHVVESGFVAYGTAKAALNHLTRLLAAEWAPRIRVNAMAVGAVRTAGVELGHGQGVRDRRRRGRQHLADEDPGVLIRARLSSRSGRPYRGCS